MGVRCRDPIKYTCTTYYTHAYLATTQISLKTKTTILFACSESSYIAAVQHRRGSVHGKQIQPYGIQSTAPCLVLRSIMFDLPIAVRVLCSNVSSKRRGRPRQCIQRTSTPSLRCLRWKITLIAPLGVRGIPRPTIPIGSPCGRPL